MRFRTTILQGGKTATGIHIPDDVVESFGAGGRPPVRVTINQHTYRSTVARRGDRYLVGVSAENREAAGVAGGDEVEVDIELDTEPREVVLPPDLAEALDEVPEARRFFDGLSPSKKGFWVSSVEGAKKPETRQRRIEKAVVTLAAGRER